MITESFTREVFTSEAVLVTENLGKKYRIGAADEPYRTLRESISGAVTAPFRGIRSRLRHFSGSSKGDDPKLFWALRNVSLEVEHGEVLGVVGKNGAGKTTLLKVLSRVTEPTEGRATLNGRVGSLLEVGTGFHPELSGRENIYLNGAILGMTKREIERKFDEIVAFAETEKFLDTQVKHYSSGMYMRLAFAVAAHLEPEILLVDEVLAVGDASFQKKCLGKMEAVARQGRTILFVSHNMGAVNALCDRAIWIDEGRVVMNGRTQEVIEAYTRGLKAATEGGEERTGYTLNTQVLEGQSLEGFRVLDCRVSNPESPGLGPRTGDPLVIEFDYSCDRDFVSPAFVVRLRDLYGMEVARLATMPISGFPIESLHRNGRLQLDIQMLPLVAGRYVLDMDFVRVRMGRFVILDHVLEFDVEPTDYYGSGRTLDRRHGLIVLDHRWTHVSRSEADRRVSGL